MKNSYLVRLATTVFITTALFLTGGCGYKNPPVPPQSVVPKAIVDLIHTTDEKGMRLTWSYPVENIKGEVLEDISSFELYRAEIKLDEYCGGCPIPFGAPIEVSGGTVFDGKLRQKASYESSLLRSGYKYFFKVRSRTGWWATSEDSNIVTFVWFQPAAAPEELKAAAGDSEIVLSWQPVSRLSDGTALENPLKYQVLRSLNGKDYEKIGELQEQTGFTDKQVQNGQKYFYTVQSVMLYRDEQVNGAVSPEVAATAVDLTPPLPPAGVTAVQTGSGLKIFWDKSDEQDIGGYRIYRRPADQDQYTMIGRVAPEYNIFVDSGADDAVRYYYAVTAVDRATPPNESIKSREATVRY
jgi:hypothetical protein